MRTVLMASVRRYARRYVAAVLAVVLGSAFVVVTATIASATKAGMLNDLATAYRGADVVVTGLDPASADRALARIGTASVNASAYPAVVVGGAHLDDVAVGSVASHQSLRWQHLSTGRYPRASDEALVDAGAARQNGIRLGERLSLDGRDYRVVGTSRHANGHLAAAVYLTWPAMQRLRDQVSVTDLVVGGSDAGRVRGVVGSATVEPVDAYLAAQAKRMTRNVDVVATMLLLFGAVAFFVSILVIANTFTVLLAQRQRDFALLRCVGATRRQVMRSVRLEALTIGIGAATLGTVLGVLVGRLLLVLAGHVLTALPVGRAHVGWGWLLAAWLTGVLVTAVASVLPARRATRVDPLTALRPLGAVDVRSRAGAARLALGMVLILAGAAMLALAMLGHLPLVMVGGGAISFLGLLLLGPVIVPACIRAAGLLTGRLLGVPGRLATANAVRNPRRTAATAASLLVGTTLVTGMVVGMATIRAAVDTAMDADHPVDVSVVGTRALPADAARRVAAIHGVREAVALRGVTATSDTRGARLGPTTVVALPAASDVPRGSALSHLAPRTAYVPWSLMNDFAQQDRLTLTAAGRSVRLHVVGLGGIDGGIVVSQATLRQLAPQAGVRGVWARAGDHADADTVGTRAADLARAWHAQAAGGLKQRAYVHLQLDVMVYAVLALLSVSLLIALFGIANTLGLSVLERTHEHALLRALGLTRAQLRATLAVEAVLLAAVTSLIGVVVGSVYALVGVRTLLDRALGDEAIHLTLPWGQLALVVAIAALAGLAACVLPARRAVRVSPAAGLAVE
ncbi:FtsX-like permease family protein [Nocardioides mangrovicus]|uniref:FtsX-like permease family protein n=1 Tax=Nocardioides mangrovicus TaxID=2478913 RepID=A0A3L8P1F9_9ACTN|nr:ABC transporter permease [Nocardioides mangrovicus]RLV48248.1 FtsX-like permease family protein [Nocardioides mangrovicus]